MHRLLPLLGLLVLPGCAWILKPEPPNPIEEAVAEIQAARLVAGCRDTLAWDPALARVAATHTVDMLVSNTIRHVNADGEDVKDRLERGGVHFRLAAENLAAGPVRGRRVVQLWYDSPGHRRNMLNCAYTHHGMAFNNAYWTHVLVRY